MHCAMYCGAYRDIIPSPPRTSKEGGRVLALKITLEPEYKEKDSSILEILPLLLG